MSAGAIPVEVRLDIESLYARYCAVLDDGPLDEWPDFFTDPCLYQLVARENHAAGRPLATLSFESRGMLRDRVYAVRETLFHQPYYQRHLVSGFRYRALAPERIAVEANYLVVRTKYDELPDVLSVGRYADVVVRDGDAWRFLEKRCIYDSELIPNSVIHPI